MPNKASQIASKLAGESSRTRFTRLCWQALYAQYKTILITLFKYKESIWGFLAKNMLEH
ncbi:MAG: hypothetical protein ACI843_002624 [Psychrobacter glaciei]|jgi:hypothetical protein